MERLNHVAHSHFSREPGDPRCKSEMVLISAQVPSQHRCGNFTLMTHDFASHLADEIAVGVSQNVVLLHLDLMKRCADLADAAGEGLNVCRSSRDANGSGDRV